MIQAIVVAEEIHEVALFELDADDDVDRRLRSRLLVEHAQQEAAERMKLKINLTERQKPTDESTTLNSLRCPGISRLLIGTISMAASEPKPETTPLWKPCLVG